MDYIHIGPVPYDEECQQVGMPTWDPIRARKECMAYVNQLSRLFPEGNFRVMRQEHDFGSYYTVVASYHDDATRHAAFKAEDNSPAYWDEEAKKELGL